MKKKNVSKLLVYTMIASVLLTGCGTKKKEGDNIVLTGKEGDYSVGENISESFSEDMNRFAFEIYDELAKEKGGENIFFSPYSISCALSMLDNAAGGNTKTQLENTLHISNGIETRNSDLKLFADSFTDEKAVLNTANSTWISQSLDLKKEAQDKFFGPITYYYNAESMHVDFSDEATKDTINSWISDKTEGMIPQMISQLDPDTDMCLINAVYFKGEWTTAFEKKDTKEETFNGANSKKTVDMMYQYRNSYKYVENNGLKGISLPYGEQNIAMEIWIADDENEKDAVEVFSELSTEEKLNLFNSLKDAGAFEIDTLGLPRFEVETDTFSIVNALKSMGIVDSFAGEAADFDTLNDDLYVTDVLHKAKIIVDESGTEAAAATAISMEKCSLDDIPERIYTFIADRPFVYVIRDVNTGTILFLGTYNDVE